MVPDRCELGPGRDRHVISATTDDRLPTRWLCLGWEPSRHPLGIDPRRTVLSVGKLCVRGLTTEAGRVVEEYERQLPDPHDIWDLLAADRRYRGEAVVLAYQSRELWTALGLWGRVQDGRVTLTGPERWERGPDGRLRRRARTWEPIQDGDTWIAHLTVLPARCCWCLLGAEQYGTYRAAAGWGAVVEALELAGWLTAYLSVIRRYRLGTWKHTAAAQAYGGWRRSYMTHAIEVHDDPRALLLERLACWGGRCEVGFVGKMDAWPVGPYCQGHYGWTVAHHQLTQPVYRLDLNSSYTAACRDYVLPTALRLYCDTPVTPEVLGNWNPGECIAHVTLETTLPVYPYSTDRLRRWHSGEIVRRTPAAPWPARERVIFPVGTFDTFLAGPELHHAWTNGCVKRVHAFAAYHLEYTLKAWAEAAWRARCEAKESGDGQLAGTIKRMLLGLPGAFARHGHRWVPLPGEKSARPWALWYGKEQETGALMRYRAVGYKVEVQAPSGEHPDSFPALFAWVTSIGRLRLWEAMQALWPDPWFYCDTDCLWTTGDGMERLRAAGWIDATALGKFKVEGECQEAEIIAPKHYIWGGEVTRAGMPRRAEPDGQGGYRYGAIDGLPVALPRRRPPTPVESEQVRRLPAQNYGRTVRPDGWTEPILLEG